MLKAILHGKVPSDLLNLEDVLTSSVFGALCYDASTEVLFRFLSQSEAIDGSKPLHYLPSSLLSEGSYVEYDFWPWWDEPDCIGCEPDVVICFTLATGQKHLILVEAKYFSGKSSEADYHQRLPTDQLAREWSNLESRAKSTGTHPTLIYLTADTLRPNDSIESSLSELSSKAPDSKPRILWLSWRQLLPVIEGSSGRMLLDLATLLRRLNLHFFEGVRVDFELTAPHWRFRSTSVRFGWSAYAEPPEFGWAFSDDK